ncbi:hypothetical protein Syun_011054 [Stephania yunnanensis]|uniref:Uncharacterized protein n=1 Tax=Stephania yunnanensis TaxID=152371 RepID=A0AAP0PG48_9MAGN
MSGSQIGEASVNNSPDLIDSGPVAIGSRRGDLAVSEATGYKASEAVGDKARGRGAARERERGQRRPERSDTDGEIRRPWWITAEWMILKKCGGFASSIDSCETPEIEDRRVLNEDEVERIADSLMEKLEVDQFHLMTPRRCIFKVPHTLRVINEQVFIPQAVSIGPYHHKKLEQYEAMEKTNDGESLGGDGAPRTLPTATQLREAGVKFKAAPPGTHLLDIKFQNKTLEIPTIKLEDQTERLFRNMIAYEQCYGERSYMADYFSVLDDLINSPSDVALLKRKGIIINWLGDDEEVSNMVNKMGKNVYLRSQDFQYMYLYKKLNYHHQTPWHRRKAKLKHDYFNSPWSFIAFLAAFADKTKLVLKRKITIGNAEEATDDCLVASLSEKLQVEHHLMSPQSCIFKVPARLGEINENAYIPHAVSIGPLNRNNSEQLKAMENHKVHYLNAFLRRRPSITLKDYVNMLRGLEEEARGCYAEEISLTSDEFVEMMILDALQWHIPFKRTDDKEANGQIPSSITIPNATQLWEAGVKLSPAPDDRHALDIKFENATLKIPTISVDDETELHLRNLIAYEQCQGCNTYIADYAAVIDNLIDSPKDVELLKRKGVIINGLGDDEEVSNMFNKIVKNVYMSEDFYYSDLYEKVNDYYENPWRKWKAKLKHDYFNTPWSTIAFSAAAVGVICTIIEADKAGPVLERTIKNEGLVTSIEKRLQAKQHSISIQNSIFRVPERLRKLNEDAFTPQVVSLGPLHRDKLQQFKGIENHKLHYLTAFLAHQSSMALLNECVDKLKGIEKQARECYAEEIELSSDEFVEMMILDGCLVIEFILRYDNRLLKDDYDPLFDNLHFHKAFQDDLLLLENQLPFIVLKMLFDVVNNAGSRKLWDTSFLGFAMKFYNIEKLHHSHEPKHLLHLVLQQYIPSKTFKENGNDPQRFRIIPRAVHLWEAGVRFQPPEEKLNLLDVTFEKGVLKMPVIDIQDQTESLIRNLIAFEQCHLHSNYVADYATLMDHLIDTESDVALLRQKEVLTLGLGDYGDVSDMFNKLGKNVVTSKDFHYVDLYNKLNAYYYRTPWHKWNAALKRDYFSTPWSTIAFVAAAIGLVCTIIQTMQAFQEKTSKA